VSAREWEPYIKKMCDAAAVPASEWTVFPVVAGTEAVLSSPEFVTAVFRNRTTEES
jgi:hypothetical protein